MLAENRLSDKVKIYLQFAGPTTFIFFTVLILPFLYGIFLTFTNWDGIASGFQFTAFENYRKVLVDKDFRMSFLLTLKYVIFSTLIINVIAFFLGYVLTSGIRGQSLLRGGFFIPNIVGGILAGYIWKFFFSDALVFIGEKLHIAILSSSWLGTPDKAFWAMVIVTVWQYSGYMMIIYIAGFMTVPKELLEAASIDGAGPFKKMIHITLPLMVPSFIICLFLSIQRCFMVYDVNLTLTNGGPYNTTRLISMHVYQRAFLSQDYGGGQAEAFFLFIVVALITVTQVHFSKKLEVEA